VSTEVSEEHIASIFRVEELAEQAKLCLQPAFTLVSCSAYFFDPEDGGDIFLRNVGGHSTDYLLGYIPQDGTLHNHRCENLKSYKVYS
jgi:hypothetical protein